MLLTSSGPVDLLSGNGGGGPAWSWARTSWLGTVVAAQFAVVVALAGQVPDFSVDDTGVPLSSSGPVGLLSGNVGGGPAWSWARTSWLGTVVAAQFAVVVALAGQVPDFSVDDAGVPLSSSGPVGPLSGNVGSGLAWSWARTSWPGTVAVAQLAVVVPLAGQVPDFSVDDVGVPLTSSGPVDLLSGNAGSGPARSGAHTSGPLTRQTGGRGVEGRGWIGRSASCCATTGSRTA
ncbi:hypothetical protein [Nocardia sp. NRRL S-836]|uniref:hypothetical protein n=1 Tax=Nocardia sp. NRRL S-836 TaxID=1519492 RepID=UPI0006AF9AE8|nr:hypothetical protein [Nocardia sp. NRRL S-836]KOV78496.1 hypothetical protein ADL03_39940 [Nocardia sp. NRRL S-836]